MGDSVPKMRPLSDLNAMLARELICAKRYRRFISLVAALSLNGSPTWRAQLEESMRDCDLVFEIDSKRFLLMTETSVDGALNAVERYKSALNNDDMLFGVSTYPADGETPADLLSAVFRRVEKAKTQGAGTVVASG